MEEKPIDNPYESPGTETKPTGFGEPSADEKQWAMFAHLAALAGYLIPFGNVVGPLIVWMMKKDEMPFVDEQGKESLNFQISMSIYLLIAGVLTCVVVGFFLLPILGILDLVFLIIAAVKANQGVSYRYPMTIRFIN